MNFAPLALLAVTCLLAGCAAPSASLTCPVRVVCIGDSITQGRGNLSGAGKNRTPTDGWRWAFWTRAVDAGIPVKFVGTMTTGFESTPVYADYKGQTFENRHEARWGWTTESQLGKLRETSREWTADVALIYLGTNREKLTDDQKKTDPDGIARTTAAMRGLLALLRENNPRMTLLVRLPVGDDSRARGLTGSFRQLAAEFDRPGAAARAVAAPADWQWDPKKEITDTIDGAHPNKNGDTKIAAGFFDAALPFLKNAR